MGVFPVNNPTDIITHLAKNELLISDLYLAYAKRFPELAEFWTNLSVDEKHHAGWLQHLLQPFTENAVSVNARFSSNTLSVYQAYLEKECTLARRGKLDLSQALSTSLHIEKSLIENRFFEIFEGRSPEWTETKKNLITETKLHLAKVQQLMAERKTNRF